MLANLSTRAWIGLAVLLLLLVIVGLVIAGLQARIRRLRDDRERCILALMVCQARSARNGEFYLDEILGVPPLNPRLRQFVKRQLKDMENGKLVRVARIQTQVTAPGRRGSERSIDLRYQFTKTGEHWLSQMSKQ